MSKGSSITLWKELDELAHKAATKFGIRKTFELRPVTHPRARHFGQCSRGGVIMLRVHRLGNPRRPLARSTILHTLAHELAHMLKWEHGPKHQERTREILAFLKGA